VGDQKYQNETIYDRLWKRVQNNPLLVAMALLAAVVTSPGGILHSANDIANVFRSKPEAADAPQLVLRGAQIVLSPQPALGSALPIHYEVDAVVGNTGSGTASHCSAQIQAPLGAYYQSLSPPEFSLASGWGRFQIIAQRVHPTYRGPTAGSSMRTLSRDDFSRASRLELSSMRVFQSSWRV
jgi:hypothetical protein